MSKPKADKSNIEWTEAKAWGDLRLAARTRLAASFRYLLETGVLNRADVQRIGEVSAAQASIDIGAMVRNTGMLEYDVRAKRYRLKEFADGR